jgi:hypothetical protein
MKKPLLMGCGHTFCKKCLNQREDNNTLDKCPQCFEKHFIPAGQMKANFAILQMLE